MRWIMSLISGIGFGFGSALLPLLNAEAYTLVSVSARPWLLVPVVLALSIGQTAGKLLLFEAARRGSTRFQEWSRLQALSSGRWTEGTRLALTERRTAVPLLVTSAALGLPPLALVSVAAGASGQRRGTFAVLCLVGRVARFTALAIPVAYATNLI